jgi:hypothetical protein
LAFTVAIAFPGCGSDDDVAPSSPDAKPDTGGGHEDVSQPTDAPPDSGPGADRGGSDGARDSEAGPLDEAASEGGGSEAAPESSSSDVTSERGPDVSADSASSDASGEAALDAGLGCNSASYPAGPYGLSVGSVIANLSWTGKVHTMPGSLLKDEPETTVCLGRYHADPAIKVLVIDGAAMWCPPCQLETRDYLVPLISANPSTGSHIAVLQGLLDALVPGQSATMNDLNNWSTRYKVPYDMVLDTSRVIANYMPPVDDAGIGYPMNLVVRSDTMQITYAAVGGTVDDLEAAINAVLSPSLDGSVIGRGTGSPCTKDAQCLGQTPKCLTVDANNHVWPGGYCTSRCSDSRNDLATGLNPQCPGGAGTCSGGTCVTACSAMTCQRSEYACFSPGCLPKSFSDCVPFQTGACPDAPAPDGGAPVHRVCFPVGPDPVGICLDGCNVFAQGCPLDGSASAQGCYALPQTGEGFCAPAGTSVDGDPCAYMNECAPGLACLGDKTGNHCTPWCGGPGNVACSNARVCTDLSGTVAASVVGLCAAPGDAGAAD